MKFRAFLQLGSVDRAKNLITGVSILSLGCARGHGVLVDDKSLETTKACIEQKYKSGLKVKFNPATFTHGTGSITGVVPLPSLRIEGGKLLGDLSVMPSYAHKEYLYDLVEAQPDTFGISIDFEADAEDIGGVNYMRCTEIFACTIVDEPAANASGMFAALPDPPANPNPTETKAMPLTPDDLNQLKTIVTDAVKPIADRVGAIEKAMGDEAEPETEGMSADEVKEELAAAGVEDKDPAGLRARKVKAYRATLGQPLTIKTAGALIAKSVAEVFSKVGGNSVGGRGAGSDPAGNGGAADGKTAFEAKLEKLTETGDMTKREATAFAIRKFPKEYEAHRRAKAGAHLLAAQKDKEEAAAAA